MINSYQHMIWWFRYLALLLMKGIGILSDPGNEHIPIPLKKGHLWRCFFLLPKQGYGIYVMVPGGYIYQYIIHLAILCVSGIVKWCLPMWSDLQLVDKMGHFESPDVHNHHNLRSKCSYKAFKGFSVDGMFHLIVCHIHRHWGPVKPHSLPSTESTDDVSLTWRHHVGAMKWLNMKWTSWAELCTAHVLWYMWVMLFKPLEV